MGFFKNLFGKKEVVKEEEVIKETPEKQEVGKEGFLICEKCKMELKPDHFIVTFNGKKWHKQCMRQIRREAKRKAFR